MTMKFTLSVFAALLLVACAKPDRELEAILRLEDRREAAKKFEAYVHHRNERVQRRAIEALGKIQDPSGLAYLTPLLDHEAPAIRAAAVFAIGQIGDTASAQTLLSRLSKESTLEASSALLEALGKTGTRDELMTIEKYLRDASPVLRAEGALALARLASREFKAPRMAPTLAANLQDADENVRWAAAYALIRCGDSTVVSPLAAALQDPSARVRMQTARALGTIGHASAALPLSTVAKQDSDWRVRVNAASALGNLPLPDIFDLLPLQDANEHVRLAALMALGIAGGRGKSPVKPPVGRQVDFLRKILIDARADEKEMHSWRERAAAALALAQCLRGDAIDMIAPFVHESPPLFRARVAQALAATRDHRSFYFLQKLAADSALMVRLAALEALPQLNDARATQVYLSALESRDEVLTAIAIQNLVADSLQRRQHVPKMIEAYRRLKSPVDVEVAQIIFESLARCGDSTVAPVLEEALRAPDRAFARAALKPMKLLTGKDYSGQLPPSTEPYQKWNWQDIKNLAGAKATIATNRGEISIQFFPEAAPLTVLNFVRLGKNNFFDGLLIHRVVPNFVIQTGDPRGDMWGSPGYAIRSEFSALRYTRGAVGMASAGPDTEGSQFFIVHSDQPRLDGRYTIFARVVKGMDVVEALQVGDMINDVVIAR
jgi:cyclophilin family peptidyl-prolyl cis-trans isomerase/HEAT repeat protein